MFERYSRYLELNFSDDYWSDEGIGYAAELVRGFSEKDWSNLAKNISSRSNTWITRCAESLGDIQNEKSIGIPIQILQKNHEPAKIAALDSINSLCQSGCSIGAYRAILLGEISKLDKSSSNLTGMIINSLELRINSLA